MAYFDLQIFAADGHLNFDTKLDEKGFTSGISKLGSIAKGGLKILGGAVAGVTSAMGAGVVAGMKYNADMQNYFANFETMLGTADAATAHVQQLKEFAAKTPFEMADLANASKTLLAFGTESEAVMPIMKQLGDISLGNKDKFNSLALVYGQVSSQGKLMGQDLMQMINAGFNPLMEISKHTGESMESLKDKMSKGQIGVEELNQALQWATEEGGQFAGGMEKASRTFDGLISTLKDNAMSLLGEVVQPITEEMTETLLPAAIDTIDQLSQAFQDDGVEGLISAGAGIVANLATGMVEQLPLVIETAIGFIDLLIQALDENMPQLLSAGGRLLVAIGQGILQLIPSLLSLGFSIVQGIISGIQMNAGQLQMGGASLLNSLTTGISTSLPQLVQKGCDSVGKFAEGLLSNLPAVISAAGDITKRLLAALLDALPELLESGVQLIGNLAAGILRNLPAILTSIGQVIVELLAEIASRLPEILQKGIELIGELAAGLILGIPELIGKIPEIFNSIKEKFASYDWIQIGKDIVSGIANGLKGAIGTVVDAAKSVGEAALNGLKNLLGIHSPSRVFRDEVGKNIALGIADGILQNKNYAKKSAEEIAQLTLDAAKKKLDNHKVYSRLTLADEVSYWNEVRKQIQDGTQARIDADKEYFNAKKSLNDQLLSAEETYTDKVARAYADLNDRVQSLNAQYRDAVNQRADQIGSAFGLFDAFESSTDLTGEDLLNNLQSQVEGLQKWRSNLHSLERRGISDGLLSELQELGPQAAAQIQLMTEMSDDQLDEYVDLFREKNRIARRQAVEEMEPMRDEIADQISKMQAETSAELAKYQQEYMTAMTELGVSLNQPLEAMKLNAAQNATALVTAMADTVKTASGSTENVDKFRQIAQNILGATDTLPASMAGVGQQAITSMIEGLQSMSGHLYAAVLGVVGTAVQGAIDAVMNDGMLEAAMAGVGNVTSTASLPASAHGSDGYGPGTPMNYQRIGQEVSGAINGMAVVMDGDKVGTVVAGPVNDALGSQGRVGNRGGR